MKLREALPRVAEKHGRVLVIGGGLTGIEAATEIAESHPQLHVELVTRGAFGEAMSPAGTTHLRKVFNRLNITIIEHASISRIDEHQALSSNGLEFPFDVCVNTTGFVAPALAREAGFAVNALGQIIIDALMNPFVYPNVYGPAMRLPSRDKRDTLRIACATAMPMAAHVADNIATMLHGEPSGSHFNLATPFAASAWAGTMRWFSLLIQWTGLSIASSRAGPALPSRK